MHARHSLAAAAAASLLVLTLAAPVLAHAELVSSDPADKAVLAASPTTITLTFSEDLDPTKSSFKLVGPAGTVGTGKVGGVTTQMLLAGLSLAPGNYEIQWTSMSTDQHLLRGTLTFTVSAPTPAPATDSPVPSAAGATPSAAATPASSPAVSAAPSPAASSATVAAASGDVVLPIVAALVLVVVAGLWLFRRSRRA
jgi:methionine-rich copper-binding protein CopC